MTKCKTLLSTIIYQSWVILLVVFVLGLNQAYAVENKDCFECHADKELTKETKEGKKNLFIDESVFNSSVHKDNDCVTCHEDIDEIPHKENLKPVNCGNCHSDQKKIFQESIHGKKVTEGDKDTPNCQTCHGSHDIKLIKNPESVVYPLNLPSLCGKCHSDSALAQKHNIPIPDAYQKYLKSVHGQGLLKSGLLVSASCNDCHGTHDIKPNNDPQSKLFKSNIPKTCGACHVGVLSEYQKSIHGKLFGKGDTKAPVCTNCHSTHTIGRIEKDEFKLKIISECGNCHENLIETYRDSYHGQVSSLGYSNVARCSDCHGAHNILPPTEPDSRLSKENIVSTCQKCHPSANEKFTKFQPHADYHNKEKFPILHYTWLFMTTLLIGVFIFFGVHNALWLIRSSVEHANKNKMKGNDNVRK